MGSARLTTEHFIQRARATHGERYGYSLSVCNGANVGVKIICLTHGVFEQVPRKHIAGCGCPKCGKINGSYNQRKSLLQFIESAEAVHGKGCYNYSCVIYKGNKVKVDIMCPKHGLFQQTPNGHLKGRRGKGGCCPVCSKKDQSKSQLLLTADYINQAQKKHGLRYDYSQVLYAGLSHKIKIVCPKHGVFEQQAGSHRSGHGCPTCANEKRIEDGGIGWALRAKGRKATLYLLRIFNECEVFYKIGVTYLSVDVRYKDKRCLPGYDYEILVTHTSDNALAVYQWEQSILESFAHLSYVPTTSFGGAGECFSSATEILSIFPL